MANEGITDPSRFDNNQAGSGFNDLFLKQFTGEILTTFDEKGRVYIVDHSGSNPTMTDDGPLLFDHQDCKEIKLKQYGDSLYANVPVLMERKSFFDAVTHVDTAAALYLGRKYGITVTHSTVLHKA